ncbi:unnamed protein product [Scytosiphon promiscuus]
MLRYLLGFAWWTSATAFCLHPPAAAPKAIAPNPATSSSLGTVPDTRTPRAFSSCARRGKHERQRPRRRREYHGPLALSSSSSSSSSSSCGSARNSCGSNRVVSPLSWRMAFSSSPSSSVSLASSSSANNEEQEQTDLVQPRTSTSTSIGGGDDEKSTLGIAHRVLEGTLVPGLAGAVLKESPSDFVVVELPQQSGSKFTPADPAEPIPKEAKKPVLNVVRSWGRCLAVVVKVSRTYCCAVVLCWRRARGNLDRQQDLVEAPALA